jgi:squalene-hopene/tetraprenyl-beta-curcumene cyclase
MARDLKGELMRLGGSILSRGLIVGAVLLSTTGALAQLQIEQRELGEWFERERIRQVKSLSLIEQGVGYLLLTQNRDGSWSPERGPGVTALAVKALAMCKKVGPEHRAVQQGIEYLERFAQQDGGYYSESGLYQNYESCVVLSALVSAGKKKYASKIEQLQQFLIKGQWDEGEEIDPNNPFYGGAGYGRHKRPDLSNTQMMVEALHESGLPKDHPAYKKALIFIQRCQMRAESNDMPYARQAKQGGFIYATANGGESKAGEIDFGDRSELRAYGSMTYAGLKSMIYANLDKDDPRVKAAFEWVRANWNLDANPGMPPGQALEGLYYYYLTFARAMAAMKLNVIELHSGQRQRLAC